MGFADILVRRRTICLPIWLLLVLFIAAPAWPQATDGGTEAVLVSAVAESGALPAEPVPSPLQIHDLETAFGLAARQGKQVVVLAHADWSSHSRKLLEIWQSDSSVREFLAGFVPVILDADKNKDQCLSLNLRAWPTTLVMQRDRSILAELRGVRDPVDYLALLTSKLERYRKP